MASNSFGNQATGLRIGGIDAARIRRDCYSVDFSDTPGQLLVYRPGRVQAVIDGTNSAIGSALLGTHGQVRSGDGMVAGYYLALTVYGADELWVRGVGFLTPHTVGVIDEYYE